MDLEPRFQVSSVAAVNDEMMMENSAECHSQGEVNDTIIPTTAPTSRGSIELLSDALH